MTRNENGANAPLVIPKWALVILVGAIAAGGGSTLWEKLDKREDTRTDVAALAVLEARVKATEIAVTEIPALRRELTDTRLALAQLKGSIDTLNAQLASESAPPRSGNNRLGR